MDRRRAEKLLDETFNQEFDIDRFAFFINELFNGFNFKKGFKYKSVPLSTEYDDYIQKLQSLGVYRDSNKETIEVFAVKLKTYSSVEKARTMQRNSIANYLKKFNRNASLVAFYGDNPEDWRFSFVKVDYDLFKDEKGNLKIDEKLTPAKRYSFLVGKNEPNYTCRSQFLPLIENETEDPIIEEIENAFSVEKVTKEFFNEYRERYLRLNESLEQIIENDPITKAEFEEKNIITADFAKKLMGQIVFIYFLQKKGWLGVEMDQEWGTGPKNFLRTLYDEKKYENFFNDVLEPLFYDALATDRYDDYYEKFECRIPFLNGGLFEPINLYNWRKTDIKIDNKIFEDILDTFDLFNFTIKEDEPLERIVAVDPEMLGKVFENLLEVKDRKSKGAFYTPREIVHYMCQQSIIDYLNTHLDVQKEDIESFIQLGDFALDSIIRAQELGQSSQMYALPESIIDEKDTINKLIDEVKIVDPAVGSGAFLVGMMNEILKVKSILSLLKDETNVNYDIKRGIIEESLYGVDLDSSAVDITKLRFWLSLIVDEEDIKDIKPLPNLDHKIMCGNSLIEEYNGIKLFDEKILHDDSSRKKELVQSTLFDERLQESRRKLKRLRELHKLYFNEQNKKQKDNYREEIDKLEWKLIEETLKEEGNEKSIQKLEQYKMSNPKPFFTWKLYFPEVFQGDNPGFDVVIGNPPYVNIYKIAENSEEVDYFKKKYETAYKKFDLYVLFIEKGIKLLKNKGTFAFIIPDKFANQPYGLKLREFILNNCNINQIVDLTTFKIFEGAVNTPIILILGKENNQKLRMNNNLRVLHPKYPKEINEATVNVSKIPQSLFLEIPDYKFRFNLNEVVISIIEKIENNSIDLGDICYINWGTRSVPQSKFHLNERINNNCKPLLVGKNIDRYIIDYNGLWLLYEKDKLYNPMFPELFENEKIIIRDVSGKKGILATYDDSGYYTSHTTSCCQLNYQLSEILDQSKDSDISENFDLHYILSLMNSKLMDFYFKMMISSGIHAYLNDLRILKIKIPAENQKIKLVDATKTILELNKNLIKNSNAFKEWLKINFKIEKFSKKLNRFYELSLEDFLRELKRIKVNYELNEDDLTKKFENVLSIINPLVIEIEKLDRKIDLMVYELYGLEESEIKIIEEIIEKNN